MEWNPSTQEREVVTNNGASLDSSKLNEKSLSPECSELAKRLGAQLTGHKAEVTRLLEIAYAQQLQLLHSRCGELEASVLSSIEAFDMEKSKPTPSVPHAVVPNDTIVPHAVVPNATDPNSGWTNSSKGSMQLADGKHHVNAIHPMPSYKQTTGDLQKEEQTSKPPKPRLNLWQQIKTWQQNGTFDCFVAMVILLNTVFMAYQTNWVAKKLREPDLGWMTITGSAFTIFFLLDLIIKLCCERMQFFTGPARNWNFFDVLVVGSAVIEEVLAILVQSGPSLLSNTKVMRVLRILRLVRVLRVLRAAKFFRELRAMVYGIMLSFSSLFWACILGCSTIFVFAVFTTQGVSAWFMEEIKNGADPSVSDVTRDKLRAHCGDLSTTMYSLWKSISGGLDWGDVADPLFEISPMMGFVFLVYIIFCTCAILNVVTGVFVNKALKIAETDMDTMILQSNQQKQEYINQISQVFQHADSNGNGFIDVHEFTRHCEDKCVQDFFRYLELDLDGTDPSVLFDMLDFDGDGELDAEEFVFGCSVLKGYARSIDLARHIFHHQSKHDALMASNEAVMASTKDLAVVHTHYTNQAVEFHDHLKKAVIRWEAKEQKNWTR